MVPSSCLHLADQNFAAALKLDPANWEAQFFKAASRITLAAGIEQRKEVIQRFSGLIDQHCPTLRFMGTAG